MRWILSNEWRKVISVGSDHPYSPWHHGKGCSSIVDSHVLLTSRWNVIMLLPHSRPKMKHFTSFMYRKRYLYLFIFFFLLCIVFSYFRPVWDCYIVHVICVYAWKCSKSSKRCTVFTIVISLAILIKQEMSPITFCGEILYNCLYCPYNTTSNIYIYFYFFRGDILVRIAYVIANFIVKNFNFNKITYFYI